MFPAQVLLRVSPLLKTKVCSATLPDIAIPFFRGNKDCPHVTGEDIQCFDDRFDQYLCGKQSKDLQRLFIPARLPPLCVADGALLYTHASGAFLLPTRLTATCNAS